MVMNHESWIMHHDSWCYQMESQTHPSGVSGWSAMMPWNIRLFFLFCSKSYLWRSISIFTKSSKILFSHLLLHLIEDVVHHLQSILGPARLGFYLQKFWFVLSPLQKRTSFGRLPKHITCIHWHWLEVHGIFINGKFMKSFSHLFSCDMGNLVNFTSVLNLK